MNSKTLLHRLVHPTHIILSQISSTVFEPGSQAFTPSDKDEGQLSVYNGEKFTAEQAFHHFCKNYESAGVMSVTVAECEAIGLNSAEDNVPFDGHSYINFTGVTKSQYKKKGKLLKKKAVERGWSFIRS